MRAAESIWSTLWVIFGDQRSAKTARAEFEVLRTARLDALWPRLETSDIRYDEWEALQQDLKRRWDSWNVLGRRFTSDVLWIRLNPAYYSYASQMGTSTAYWVPFTALYVTIRRLLGSTPNTRIARGIRRNCCPQCYYSLAGADDVVSRLSRGAVSPGPRLCPECGLAWPCVPPHLVPTWRAESTPGPS